MFQEGWSGLNYRFSGRSRADCWTFCIGKKNCFCKCRRLAAR